MDTFDKSAAALLSLPYYRCCPAVGLLEDEATANSRLALSRTAVKFELREATSLGFVASLQRIITKLASK